MGQSESKAEPKSETPAIQTKHQPNTRQVMFPLISNQKLLGLIDRPSKVEIPQDVPFQIPIDDEEMIPGLKASRRLQNETASPILTSFRGIIREKRTNRNFSSHGSLKAPIALPAESPSYHTRRRRRRKKGAVFPDTANMNAWIDFGFPKMKVPLDTSDPCLLCDYNLYYRKYDPSKFR